MRAIVQRVIEASVTNEDKLFSKIETGLLVYSCWIDDDEQEDVIWMSKKITQMRIFNGENGKPDINLNDADAELMIVSQFSLYASLAKGNRPSFTKAAKPEICLPLYHSFIQELNTLCKNNVKCGMFGTDMNVHSINNGPMTIILDSKRIEL
ncbi:MAG: D-aminoacyl-tRNA deacylase [Bacteroidota bacterium]|nr:D-aminoacyl-tRNA deacylase [Bacteroidota bacterium]